MAFGCVSAALESGEAPGLGDGSPVGASLLQVRRARAFGKKNLMELAKEAEWNSPAWPAEGLSQAALDAISVTGSPARASDDPTLTPRPCGTGLSQEVLNSLCVEGRAKDSLASTQGMVGASTRVRSGLSQAALDALSVSAGDGLRKPWPGSTGGHDGFLLQVRRARAYARSVSGRKGDVSAGQGGSTWPTTSASAASAEMSAPTPSEKAQSEQRVRFSSPIRGGA